MTPQALERILVWMLAAKSWGAANVKVVPKGDRTKAALKLAAKCIADAAMCGIFVDDLERAAGGSVLNYILIAIEARERQVLEDMLKRVRPKSANGTKEPKG